MDTQSAPHSPDGAAGGLTAAWLPRALTALVLAGAAFCALVFITHGVRLVLFPFDIDNSEGVLLYQGVRLAQGQFLYSPLDAFPYLVDNYPPVYPLFLAAVFWLTGPVFWWPRLLSLVATLLTAVLLGAWIRRRTGEWAAAWLGGLAYLLFYHVYDWGALGRVDALGVLFAVSGLWVFARWGRWQGAVPLFLLALFTRQTLFAAPLAVFFTLWQGKENHGAREAGPAVALRFLLTLGVLGALGLGLLMLGTGGRAWSHLVTYNANTYRWFDVWLYTRHWFWLYPLWGLVPVAVLLTLGRTGSPGEKTRGGLLFWYTLLALGEALLCGKIGSAPNYLLSLVCATVVGLGDFHTLAQRAGARWRTGMKSLPLTGFLLASLVQLWINGNWMWHIAKAPSEQEKSAGLYVQRILQNETQPVLADLAGLPLLAGHPPVFEPFICSQLAREGVWDQEVLICRIEATEFGLVLLRFDLEQPWDIERYTPEMITALRTQYRLQRRIGPYFLYSPKNGQGMLDRTETTP
ncbi:MAG: glycosyltransferase family 39 protein [bacterium]|jgi:hypothetical protein|nr:glycosyltransferase family 39 protein [bacterium]